MIRLRPGKVLEVLAGPGDVAGGRLQELLVEVEGTTGRAVNYPGLTGPVLPGDRVVLNTTAVWLGLGTGGYHFVLQVGERLPPDRAGPGHLMKLRYTPLQIRVEAVEEQGSPHHERLRDAGDLEGMPIVAAELHSQVAPVIAGLKSGAPTLRVAYIMTDGGALPLAFSRTVRALAAGGLLDGTITAGHAFGGDLEAINPYSALLAARLVLRADVAVVAMGPGVAGTGTRFGFSGLEQGQAINAAGSLGGTPVCVPRLSWGDRRERHQGLSHHTLTVLERVALVPCHVPLPDLPDPLAAAVRGSLARAMRTAGHRPAAVPGDAIDVALGLLKGLDIDLRHMGRGYQDDPWFFRAAAGSGVWARELFLSRRQPEKPVRNSRRVSPRGW